MPVEACCPSCGALPGAEGRPGGRCPACAWEAVSRALKLERIAALLAFWVSLGAMLGECGFFLMLRLATNPPSWLLLFINVQAGFLALVTLLALIALVVMIWALFLHCAVPPLVRLREPALATAGCVIASGLAVIAAVLVIVYANAQDDREAGHVPTLLVGASLLLWYLGQVVHVVYLRRLALHFGDRRLAGDLDGLRIVLLAFVPMVAFAEIVLLTRIRRWTADVGLSIAVFSLQVPVPILLYWFATLVARVRALVPQKPQEVPGPAPDSAAAFPKEEPSP